MIVLNYLTFFAFAVSITNYYSLAMRSFLAKREFSGIADVLPSVLRINSFSLLWNQANIVKNSVSDNSAKRAIMTF